MLNLRSKAGLRSDTTESDGAGFYRCSKASTASPEHATALSSGTAGKPEGNADIAAMT
ncbi:MAG: hypothetical protein AB8B63_16270 [Granulosicoccus sp.]